MCVDEHSPITSVCQSSRVLTWESQHSPWDELMGWGNPNWRDRCRILQQQHVSKKHYSNDQGQPNQQRTAGPNNRSVSARQERSPGSKIFKSSVWANQYDKHREQDTYMTFLLSPCGQWAQGGGYGVTILTLFLCQNFHIANSSYYKCPPKVSSHFIANFSHMANACKLQMLAYKNNLLIFKCFH